jgi:hypothetical protein
MDLNSRIARRATLAAQYARALDTNLDTLAAGQQDWRTRAAHTRTLATILGVDPATVIVVRDPVRGTRYPAYVITVHDHSTSSTAMRGEASETVVWRFVPDVTNGSYLLLGPCRRCGQEIPTHVIASLVDLGRVLDGHGSALTAPDAAWDEGHHTGCPLYQPDDTETTYKS